jgi:hypothetical protein
MRQKNNENQQNNKDCEIDSRVFNFLVRRLNIEEKIHFSDLKVVTYSFEGYPNYGFTNFMNKKQMESRIILLLSENDIVDIDLYSSFKKFNPEIQKIIRIIRVFLNSILR